MLTKSLADWIQEKLNIAGDTYTPKVNFRVTDNVQLYETYKLNADGETYNPCVVSPIDSPISINDTELIIYTYEFRIKGLKDYRRDIEKVVNSIANKQTATLDSLSYIFYHDHLTFDSFKNSNGGKAIEYFEGRFTIQLHYIKGGISGVNTTVTLDGTAIPFNFLRYRKDKGLIPNVAYGTNTSDKINQTSIELEIPYTSSNAKVSELFNYGVSDGYNKKFTLVWTVGVVAITWDVTCRIVSVAYNNNTNPLFFTVVMDKALTRRTITVDSSVLPILNMTYGFTGTASDGKVDETSKLKKVNVYNGSATLSALFVYDGSAKANALIAELNNGSKNVLHSIVYQVGTTSYTNNYVITGGQISIGENPDETYQISFSIRDGAND